MSRRSFVRTCAGVAAAIAFDPRSLAASLQSRRSLRIAIALPARDSLFQRGFDLGISEAQRAASLFNASVASQVTRVDSLTSLNDSVAALESSRVGGLVSCADDATTLRIAEACARHRVPHFNCGSRADSLRRNFCGGYTMHVEGSAAMYSAAASAAGAKDIALWSPKLEKYGAAQLNDRFREFAKTPMNSAAWAGWFAVKVIWESFLRSKTDITMIMATSQFDGHKGAPLSFRKWDGQLRQPLYAVGTRIIDVPDVAKSDKPSREVLDTIGDREGMKRCAR
ncbi:MAG TPA: hypothetical protein VF042_14635 [Gemmatimonadaceae bacterium]